MDEQKIVDSLCQPIEETGNPVQCYPVENYPLGVKVQIEPTQAGEGDPSPDNIRPISGRDAVSVTRCGKNLLKNKGNKTIKGIEWTFDDQGLMSIKGTIGEDISDYYFLGKNGENAEAFTTHVDLVLSSNYVTNDGNCIFGARTDAGLLRNQGTFNSVSIPSGTRIYGVFMRVLNKTVDYSGIYAQLELGSTATPYEPYTGSTTDIALPETVYGGTLDVETGVLTVDRKVVRFTSDSKFYINSDVDQNDTTLCGTFQIDDADVTDFAGQISNVLPHASALGFSSAQFSIVKSACFSSNPNDKYSKFLYVRLNRDWLTTQDLAGFKEWLDNNALMICYKIKTPYTIQLTPQQIAALSGVNTIYTDADGVVVTGAEDPKHTITELKNAIISLGGNV